TQVNMPNKRREFLKLAGLTGMGVAGGGMLKGFAAEKNTGNDPILNSSNTPADVNNNELNEKEISIIGLYGGWASSLNENKLPSFSFRRKEWQNLSSWKKAAKQRLSERLGIHGIDGMPAVKVDKQYSYDCLHID